MISHFHGFRDGDYMARAVVTQTNDILFVDVWATDLEKITGIPGSTPVDCWLEPIMHEARSMKLPCRVRASDPLGHIGNYMLPVYDPEAPLLPPSGESPQ